MTLSIRHKITGAFLLLSLLPIAVGTFFAIRTLITQTEAQAWESLRKDMEIANFALDQRQAAIRAITGRLSETIPIRSDLQPRQTDELADYLDEAMHKHGLQMLILADSQGRIIAHGGPRTSGQPGALKETTLPRELLLGDRVSIEVIPARFLELVGMRHALGVDQPSGMMITAVSSVAAPGGEASRFLLAGYLLNNDAAIADEFENLRGSALALYLGPRRISTDAREKVGKRKLDESLSPAIEEQVFREKREVFRQARSGGQQFFASYGPIFNGRTEVIGVLFLGRPAAPYTTLRSAVQNRFLMIALVLVLVATAVGYALARGLTRSLLELARGADRIAKGDLSVQVEVKSRDEAGALATAFNEMVGELAQSRNQLREYAEQLEQRVQDRTRELTRSLDQLKALGEVGQTVSSTLNLKAVLTAIVSHSVELTGSDSGAIYEYDESAREFQLRATHQMEEELIEALRANPIRLGEGAVGRAAAARKPFQIPDIEVSSYEPRLRIAMGRSGHRAFLAVPLLREDRIVGGLVVRRKSPGEFAPELVGLLQTFAAESTIAIQNARLFREIEEKGRQLEVASRHKSQFLANMSHELRTPLNAILGYIELMLDGIFGELPEAIRDSLERSRMSGRHLLGLINDVLDLSKIEAGQLTLSLTDYSMADVLLAVSSSLESLAADKQLALTVTADPDLPPGHGDERRITQVLLNLVGNAIKFTETGGVRIAATVADGLFRVAVSDTGPGIATDDQARIFAEFQQADSSSTRTKGGTGLGLAIAKRIVEMHGGRIGVDSTPGKGSTFWFTVPVRVERQVERT
jgi:signal transduction histidine kinase